MGCQRPRTISGAPQRITPNMKAGLSLFAPVSEIAAMPPTNAPTPIGRVQIADAL